MELSMLCDCRCLLLIQYGDKVVQYSDVDVEKMLDLYWETKAKNALAQDVCNEDVRSGAYDWV